MTWPSRLLASCRGHARLTSCTWTFRIDGVRLESTSSTRGSVGIAIRQPPTPCGSTGANSMVSGGRAWRTRSVSRSWRYSRRTSQSAGLTRGWAAVASTRFSRCRRCSRYVDSADACSSRSRIRASSSGSTTTSTRWILACDWRSSTRSRPRCTATSAVWSRDRLLASRAPRSTFASSSPSERSC